MSPISSSSSGLSDESETREDVARAARAGDVPRLIDMLADARWTTRREIVAALAALGDTAVGPMSEALVNRRDNEARIAALVDALGLSTGAVHDAVMALASSPEPAVVADVAQILGRRRNAQAVPMLISLTAHVDDNVAVGAIEALGRIGGRAAVDELAAVLRGANFFRIFPAIDVLGRSGDPRAVEPLVSLLDDSRYALEAARALGRTGERLAVAPLARLAAHPSHMVGRVAACALGDLLARYVERYGDADLIEGALRQAAGAASATRIAQLLARAEPDEQAALCRVLGVVGGEPEASLLVPLLNNATTGPAAAAALQALGRKADRALTSAIRNADSAQRVRLLPLLGDRTSVAADVAACLTDDDDGVRVRACEALARIGDTHIVSALFELLDDSNPRVVNAATAAIQSLGGAETEPLVLRAAASGRPNKRRAALRLIAYFGYGSAFDLVAQAVTDPDARLRDGALNALAFLDDPRALGALLAASSDADAGVRAAATRALGQLVSTPAVVARLIDALGDEAAWVRYYACQALGRLQAAPAEAALIARLNDDAGQVRVAAIEALARLPGEAARHALAEAASSPDADVHRAALLGLGAVGGPGALALLLAAASSPEAATRLVGVSALALRSEQEAHEALERAANDESELVRNAATDVLATAPGVHATRALIALLRAAPRESPGEPAPPARIRLLSALARPAAGRIEGILTALTTGDDELSIVLATALGRLPRADATRALVAALMLPHAAARKAAALALGAIGTPAAHAALRPAATDDPDPEVRRLCALALA